MDIKYDAYRKIR